MANNDVGFEDAIFGNAEIQMAQYERPGTTRALHFNPAPCTSAYANTGRSAHPVPPSAAANIATIQATVVLPQKPPFVWKLVRDSNCALCRLSGSWHPNWENWHSAKQVTPSAAACVADVQKSGHVRIATGGSAN